MNENREHGDFFSVFSVGKRNKVSGYLRCDFKVK